MDYFKIPRNNKRSYISLEKRINLIPEEYYSLKDGFYAMKWLGNTGSHNLRTVDKEDIDAACYMLDDFLQRIFKSEENHSETIERLNRNHNPNMRNKE
jgi:hypothetical protein